jgi:hypothetical protein
MDLQERNFVDTQRRKRLEGVPINGGGALAVEDAFERVRGDIFFGLHITQGAID